MTALVDRTIKELKSLPSAEQKEFLIELQRFIEEEAAKEPRIRKSPEVIGGRARIRDMRIPVSLIVYWLNIGWKDDELIINYPGLEKEDIMAVRDYYQSNRAEINLELEEE